MRKIMYLTAFGLLLVSITHISRAVISTVQVQVAAGVITYGAPASFSIPGTIISSPSAQTYAQDFTGVANYFRIQDLKGTNSGYNTTLQVSDLTGQNGNVISGTNIFFKAFGSVLNISGNNNPRVILDSNTSNYQALNASRTFIYRDSGLNTGAIGYYGAQINLQINIPAWQQAGTYVGQLTYTLIEN